jgi:hypothetical protein
MRNHTRFPAAWLRPSTQISSPGHCAAFSSFNKLL